MTEPAYHPVDATPDLALEADRAAIDRDEPSSDLHADARPMAEEVVQGMIPARSRRRTRFERVSMRTLATGGIIGIATALGAVLVGNGIAGWIVGLAVGLTSVILAAVLWSSRQL